MRRWVFSGIAVLGAAIMLGLIALWLSPGLQNWFISRGAHSRLMQNQDSLLSDGALHIVLCGTGSPIADPTRAGACTAVIAGGHIVLIDSGPGSYMRLAEARLPLQKIDTILLTHLHSDHIGDLGETALQSWVAGRSRPLDVYGPDGTASVIAGFDQVYDADHGFRIAHHGLAYLPRAGGQIVAHTIALPPPHGDRIVYSRGGLVISAFLVDHHPVFPAFGYRIAYKGRVAIVSGDTRPNANVEHFSKGADVLIHEALDARLVKMLAAQLDATGDHRRAKMLRDTITYHTSPVAAAHIANKAHVRLLVFTHVVPPLPNALMRHIFMDGVRDAAGDVPVVLGRDDLMLTLPPGGTRIEQKELL